VTIDAERLKAMIAEDKLGLLELPVKAQTMTSDERLMASFTEITEFVRENSREPALSGSDMAEMKLAFRLDGLRGNDDHREALAPHDELSLLGEPEPPSSLEEAAADDPLGLLEDTGGLHDLRHVPKRPLVQPDSKAQREPCEDFELFEPLFTQCHAELAAGVRKLIPFSNEQQIRQGAFYVHSGVLTYVAAEGERFKERGRWNARLRCIFENGTEADLLLRSLSSRLYKTGGKSVTDPIDTSNDAVEMQLDGRTGYLYVLRSLSDDPQVTAIPDLHKLGFTTLTLAQRMSGAKKHATFLGADVEEVASYEMPAAMARGVEKLLHQFFGAARVDAWFEQGGATSAEANEWFSVPVDAIDKAIELLQAEAIESYEYDPEMRSIRLRA
jgi:hypothetical protein